MIKCFMLSRVWESGLGFWVKNPWPRSQRMQGSMVRTDPPCKRPSSCICSDVVHDLETLAQHLHFKGIKPQSCSKLQHPLSDRLQLILVFWPLQFLRDWS